IDMSLFRLLSDFFDLPAEYQCPDCLQNDYFVRLRLGIYFLLSGILLILLYIPCFIVMLKSKSRNPSFRVMIILAVFDIINLAVNSVSTGIFSILGASFCQYPRLIFIVGAIGNGTWMAGCAMCILLAMDRCVEIHSKFFLAFLFHKKAFRVVLGVVGMYWMYSVWFTKPLLFSARYSSWFFDPKINRDPNIYRNVPHTINNLVVSASTTGLYIYMCIFLLYKKGKSTNSMWMSRNKNQVILQAIIICSFHALAAYIYVYMQLFYSPPLLIILGQLTWQWSNGCFCVVYLTINKSIRSSVKKMLL
ncbi:Protein CBG01417, partial [Caenorhabditis briggsae]